MLGQSFDSRLDSDYDIAFHPDREMAEQTLRDAKRFFKRVEQYFQQVDSG